LVSDPADGDTEWIELYNKLDKLVNLESWAIEEGSGAKTKLSGQIGKGAFIVIEKPKGNLNNKGDIVILRDAGGNLIDQVTYGNWNDGQTDNNAPVAADPYSIARKLDGYNTFNNANDFSLTSELTKGTSNIIIFVEEGEEEITTADRAQYDYSNEIIISEIFPNPAGNDSEAEFIEVYNKSESDVNLAGWRLGDETNKRYTVKENLIIKTKEYLVIYREDSGIALNNSGDTVKLFQPLLEAVYQEVKYEASQEDWSYNWREVDGKYVWSEIVTPGQANEIKEVNHEPVVEFSCSSTALTGQPVEFDGSDSWDEDGDELIFFWDFGDGFTNILINPEHTFLQAGTYSVRLEVNDDQASSSQEKIIKIVAGQEELTADESISFNTNAAIIINELLPNPAGNEATNEWIEIYNPSESAVNLLNWKLADSGAADYPFIFKTEVNLGPGMFSLITRPESKLTLNNNSDSVSLFNSLDELIDTVEYKIAAEGESYARGANGKWFWTTALTPGEENTISLAASQTVSSSVSFSSAAAGQDNPAVMNLEEVKNCAAGDKVEVEGIVAVEPGVLGTQYFYIVGSAGVQVYSYKKDFPPLSRGDYIRVRGEISLVNGEHRLKTATAADMEIIERKDEPIPVELICDKIDDSRVGELITVSGEVTERKSSTVYLDDGTDEIRVYVKNTTGINPAVFEEGSKVTVAGILTQSSSGPRLAPRSPDDIVSQDVVGAAVAGQPEVLGEVTVADEWEIAARDKKMELMKYVLITAGALIIILSGLLIRARKTIKN